MKSVIGTYFETEKQILDYYKKKSQRELNKLRVIYQGNRFLVVSKEQAERLK